MTRNCNSRRWPAATSCSGCGPPGCWARPAPDADAYAKEVVVADFEEAGDNDVLHKVAKDLADKGITEQQIRAQMNELLAVAVAQIQAGT